jgi:hypothetical protein
MSPPPVYRWKSFWLGLLILGFVGWAWMQSMDHLQVLGVRGPSAWVYLAQSNGNTCIAPNAHPPVLGTWMAINERIYPSDTQVWWNQLCVEGLVLPYWLLMILPLVPWLGFLALRWQRLRKIQTSIKGQ